MRLRRSRALTARSRPRASASRGAGTACRSGPSSQMEPPGACFGRRRITSATGSEKRSRWTSTGGPEGCWARRRSGHGGDLVTYVVSGTTLGNDRLLVGDPNTGDRTVILRMTHFNSDAFIASIAFAPDGTSLVFCAVDIGGPGVARLYTIGIDGSAPTLVADRPLYFADWSADGELVAAAGGGLHRLVTLDPDGSDQTTILRQPGLAFDGSSPSWSPDGSTI